MYNCSTTKVVLAIITLEQPCINYTHFFSYVYLTIFLRIYLFIFINVLEIFCVLEVYVRYVRTCVTEWLCE